MRLITAVSPHLMLGGHSRGRHIYQNIIPGCDKYSFIINKNPQWIKWGRAIEQLTCFSRLTSDLIVFVLCNWEMIISAHWAALLSSNYHSVPLDHHQLFTRQLLFSTIVQFPLQEEQTDTATFEGIETKLYFLLIMPGGTCVRVIPSSLLAYSWISAQHCKISQAAPPCCCCYCFECCLCCVVCTALVTVTRRNWITTANFGHQQLGASVRTFNLTNWYSQMILS